MWDIVVWAIATWAIGVLMGAGAGHAAGMRAGFTDGRIFEKNKRNELDRLKRAR